MLAEEHKLVIWRAITGRAAQLAFSVWCLGSIWLLSVVWVDLWRDPTGVLPFWRSGDTPPSVAELADVPPVGDWPRVDFLSLNGGGDNSPVALMLHIFSTPKKASKARRDLIRELSPLEALPERLRHLVEIKFVLGHPPTTEGDSHFVSEEALAFEQAQHGDLLRLRNLEGGDNMDHGKTWEWIRYVGRENGREALWVAKMDDDTLPFLQNLLPWLLTLDPAQPVYFGRMQNMAHYETHFAIGPLYGFSRAVARSIAAADVSEEQVRKWYWEDQRTALLINSLPPPFEDAIATPAPPILPLPTTRPRRRCHRARSMAEKYFLNVRHLASSITLPEKATPSGVKWIDLAGQIVQWFHPAAKSAESSFAWHGFKTDKSYRAAWETAQAEMRGAGLSWEWVPPNGVDWLARDSSGKKHTEKVRVIASS